MIDGNKDVKIFVGTSEIVWLVLDLRYDLLVREGWSKGREALGSINHANRQDLFASGRI